MVLKGQLVFPYVFVNSQTTVQFLLHLTTYIYTQIYIKTLLLILILSFEMNLHSQKALLSCWRGGGDHISHIGDHISHKGDHVSHAGAQPSDHVTFCLTTMIHVGGYQ